MKRLRKGKTEIVCGIAVIFLALGGWYHSQHGERETAAKNRRNAQNIASVYASAKAAASTFPKIQTKQDVIQALRNGVPSYGFAYAEFVVPNLSDSDAEALAKYLNFDPQTKDLTFATPR